MPSETSLAVVAGGGVVGGLVLLVRGLRAQRAAARISGTSGSRIATLAVGEVLVSGAAEPIELTLVSPLQSVACLYYRATVHEAGEGEGRTLMSDERAIGFRVRDPSGAIRVFPSGARFDVPDRFDETSGTWDGEPPGLLIWTGPTYAPAADDRAARVAALLTVQPSDRGGIATLMTGRLVGTDGRRRYREARIEPGETVTVLGQALPFADIDDPARANVVDGSLDGAAHADPEIAADLAEARATGTLAATPAEAWGNAAIPGFGIGRPVRAPELDPAAMPPPPPDPGLAARAAAAFEIAPDALVLAAAAGAPLVVSLGSPTAAAARGEWQLVVGLAGAILAIGSAMALAILLDGGFR